MPSSRTVLVLHGLWMHAPAMGWFASGLRQAGFEPLRVGYASVTESSEASQARIRAALARHRGAHLVGHSLGGLLALQAVADAVVQAGRIVCLGSPVAGSAAAQGVAEKVPAGGRLIGRNLQLLQTGIRVWPEDIAVGMVAGNRRLGLGGVVASFREDHDGTVAVTETRAPQLTDHVVVDASHSGLIFSREALRQTCAFLEVGRFLRG